MKKFIALFAVLLACSHVAEAKLVSITDWQPSLKNRSNTKPPKEEEQPVNCIELCPGYSVTVTICPVYGETQESCPVAGCGHYYRCVRQD